MRLHYQIVEYYLCLVAEKQMLVTVYTADSCCI